MDIMNIASYAAGTLGVGSTMANAVESIGDVLGNEEGVTLGSLASAGASFGVKEYLKSEGVNGGIAAMVGDAFQVVSELAGEAITSGEYGSGTAWAVAAGAIILAAKTFLGDDEREVTEDEKGKKTVKGEAKELPENEEEKSSMLSSVLTAAVGALAGAAVMHFVSGGDDAPELPSASNAPQSGVAKSDGKSAGMDA